MKILLPAIAATTLALTAGLSHAADGKVVFEQNCAMCHVPGLANSPKLGDKEAWAPRVKTGRDALMQSALKGKGVMPAKGGNPKLSDEEVAAALDHILASVN